MSHSIARSFNVALFTSALLGVHSVALAQAAAPTPVTGQTTVPYANTAPGGSESGSGAVTGQAPSEQAPEQAPSAQPAFGSAPSGETPTITSAGGPPSPSQPDAVTERAEGYEKLRSRGVDFYVGIGGSFAQGSYSADIDDPISDTSLGAFTGLLGVGYRFSPHFYLGAYAEGGVGAANTAESFSACKSEELSCSSALVRYGFEGRYTFNPADQLAWWAGVGVGVDVFAVSAKDKESDRVVASVLSEGSEVSLKAGVNFPAAKGSTGEVFIGYSRGSLDKVSVAIGSSTGEVENPGSNGWLSVGAALVL